MAKKADKTNGPTAPEQPGTIERIQRAALDEFAEYGLEGGRIDRIAERAQVNKAMIYYHFKSKNELYTEVLRSFYLQIGSRAREDLDRSETLEEALLRLATLHAEVVLNNPQVRPLILREMASPNPEVLNAIAESMTVSGIPQRIVEILERELSRGGVRAIDPRHVVTTFIGMSIGYFAFAPLTNQLVGVTDVRGFIKERPPIIVDIFLNGLKTEQK